MQAGGIVENPRAFGRMPPTMHESTKHPQRGRRTESIDRFPEINGSGVPDSLPFHKKYVARPQKSFRIDPFFKRGRRVAGRGALQREPGCGAGHPAGVSRLGFRVSLSQSNRMPSAAHFRRSSSLQREDWTCPTCTFSKITIQILDCPMPPPTVRGSSP